MLRKIYILFGPPGSGKGTQAQFLVKKFGLPDVSPGELLRHEETMQTRIGKKIAKTMKAGKLAGDGLVKKVLLKRLKMADAQNGFILDGYPRDRAQLKFLSKKIIKKTDQLYFIEITADSRTIRQRLSYRRVCPHDGATYHLLNKKPKRAGKCDLCGTKLIRREDDYPQAIARRLRDYKTSVKDLLVYAKKTKRLIKLDGTAPLTRTRRELSKRLKELN